MRRVGRIRGLTWLVALIAGCLACGDSTPQRSRVLLIGIDGAAPKVVRRLLKEGRLPNLARLAKDGAFGELRSSHPLWSPRIWNSIVTGKKPEKHGILAFTKEDEAGLQHLYLSHDRKVPALWNIASAKGLSVSVVNFWNTYPPERINGVMISDHALPGEVERRRTIARAEKVPSAPVAYPESWQPRILELMADHTTLTRFADPFSGDSRLPAFVDPPTLSHFWKADSQVVRIALAVEDELRPDLTLVFMPGIDRVSHWLWGSLEPAERYPEAVRFDREQREAAEAALLRYYEYTDALIGLLVEQFSSNDLILVVSDHGFEGSFTDVAHGTGTHWTHAAQDGVIFAHGPRVSAAEVRENVTVNDITPSILAWLGFPLARDMDGKPAFFLDVVSAATIDSYDETPIDRIEASASGAEQRIIEQLRSLGYVE